MIYEIDTEKLSEDITYRIRMGFTLREAVLLCLVYHPPLWEAIVEGIEKGMGNKGGG